MDDRREYQKQYYRENRERVLERHKQYRSSHKEESKLYHKEYGKLNRDKCRQYQADNREACRAACKKWWEKNKERHRANGKRWRLKNKDSIRARAKLYEAKNRDHLREYKKTQRDKNREQVRRYHREYQKKRIATPRGKIDHRMSASINEALKYIGGKRGRSWESLVGYTTEDLQKALQQAFQDGMNWAAFLQGRIHIDHIIPKTKFRYESTDDIEFRRCWAIENLQPKWALDNHKKHAKLEGPAQIPLGI